MLRIIKALPVVLSILFLVNCSQKENTTHRAEQKSEKESLARGNVQKNITNYQKYTGAWFEIEYPERFIVEPSLKSSTNVEGFDSALFTSPDGKVRFYIFSPQWAGKPEDISLKSSDEILTDSSSAVNNGLTIKRWTIAAKDGSYFRSYESTSETPGNIGKVVGISYAENKYLEIYKKEYLHFKNSLQQFAD
ncbi:hypothetical protein [Chryseobacterium sp.]|uniref:hypothetical protein n=1 Tax=Chryseobacterium sp. TaxID=1871047 RepID=UPI0011CAF43F|nr:hypothetical protein [Chryseobacterium sp.]TXF78931.1 hypothetical protein FUA25_00615 [Chryseobacterium sp.]